MLFHISVLFRSVEANITNILTNIHLSVQVGCAFNYLKTLLDSFLDVSTFPQIFPLC